MTSTKGRCPVRKISIGSDWTFFHLVLSTPLDQKKLKILQLFIIRVADHRFKLEQNIGTESAWSGLTYQVLRASKNSTKYKCSSVGLRSFKTSSGGTGMGTPLCTKPRLVFGFIIYKKYSESKPLKPVSYVEFPSRRMRFKQQIIRHLI